MNKNELIKIIKKKKSFLCIGLDTELSKIPKHLLKFEDPVFEFNRQIIDATHDLCISYKPNTAFYESAGVAGWQSLTRTVEYINDKYNDVFLIADAKRGDIGNTSALYAKTFFDKNSSGLDFDAVTVAPYMGVDSVSPFLDFKNKWVILLALTSNESSNDFQMLPICEKDYPLYMEVIKKSKQWGSDENMMYVIGATKAQMLRAVRNELPNHFLLVPGIGAQGGSLSEVAAYGMNCNCGLIVNSSRNIIYAGKDENFAQKARDEADLLQNTMSGLLSEYEVI